MNEKFLIARHIKDFIKSLDDIVINYPKREYELRNRLLNTSYDLLELVYLANNQENKYEYRGVILSKISMLDYYLECSYRKKIISEKVCLNKSNKLIIITKMIYKWMENESNLPTTT